MSAEIKASEETHGRIGYRELLVFFLPLAATPLLISTIHSFMNAAMARLPFPELSIAVFTVVKSFTNAIKGPDLMFTQVYVSLVEDRQSYRMTAKFVWPLCGAFFAVLFVLGYTPAGGWFLRNVMGLSDPEAIEFAYRAMRISCFLPIVETLRNNNRGLAVGLERTKIVTAGTLVRMLLIFAFLGWAVYSQALEGIVAAALAWTMGIGIEGLIVAVGVFVVFGSPLRAAEKMPGRRQKRLAIFDILIFFAPLAVMRLFHTSLQPIVQSGIARSPVNPTRALAAYGVAWGLIMIITGPLRMLHHCSLVYVEQDDERTWQIVRRFCFLMGGAITLLLLAIGLSPAGYWIMRRVIAVSEPVAQTARPVLIAFGFLPFLYAVREAYWGLLMNSQNTSLIGVAKGINAGTVFGLLLIAFGPLAGIVTLSPAVVGALALTAGEGVETLSIWLYSVRNVSPAQRSAVLSS